MRTFFFAFLLVSDDRHLGFTLFQPHSLKSLEHNFQMYICSIDLSMCHKTHKFTCSFSLCSHYCAVAVPIFRHSYQMSPVRIAIKIFDLFNLAGTVCAAALFQHSENARFLSNVIIFNICFLRRSNIIIDWMAVMYLNKLDYAKEAKEPDICTEQDHAVRER